MLSVLSFALLQNMAGYVKKSQTASRPENKKTDESIYMLIELSNISPNDLE